MRKELTVFLTAVMYFTRIPCPKHIDHSQSILDKSARYYPLIGWIVGAVTAFVFYAAQFVFPVSISVLLSMVSGILLTGAFHEDGFADVCDGFGGGWDKMQILYIMKDSRLGTYGTIGLVMMLLGKYLALLAIHPLLIPVILVIGHSVSRFISSIFRMMHGYVRENEDSKAKPMAKTLSLKNFSISAVFGLAPLLLLRDVFAVVLIVPVLITVIVFAGYAARRIGGYTGDCLGAAQQLCELVFYLSFIALWPSII